MTAADGVEVGIRECMTVPEMAKTIRGAVIIIRRQAAHIESITAERDCARAELTRLQDWARFMRESE